MKLFTIVPLKPTFFKPCLAMKPTTTHSFAEMSTSGNLKSGDFLFCIITPPPPAPNLDPLISTIQASP